MKLSDFSTDKAKGEMKHWGKLTLILLGVATVGILGSLGISAFGTFFGQQAITAGLFLVGAISASVGLLYTPFRYLEERKSYRQHYKYLENNQDKLTYADNFFVMQDENGNRVETPAEKRRKEAIERGERKDYLKEIQPKIVNVQKSENVNLAENDLTK